MVELVEMVELACGLVEFNWMIEMAKLVEMVYMA